MAHIFCMALGENMHLQMCRLTDQGIIKVFREEETAGNQVITLTQWKCELFCLSERNLEKKWSATFFAFKPN